MRISVLPQRLTIFQHPHSLSPAGAFFTCTHTPTESSYVMEDRFVPPGANAAHPGWRALMVHGPLDFSLTGVLASIAQPLAQAAVSIFALSTFDTDYVLIRESSLAAALDVLRAAGHEVSEQ